MIFYIYTIASMKGRSALSVHVLNGLLKRGEKVVKSRNAKVCQRKKMKEVTNQEDA